EDGRRVHHELHPAALAALVFALEDNHLISSVDELLWLQPVLIPYLVVFVLPDLPDLAEATRDIAFLDAPDRPVLLDVRIQKVGDAVPITAFEKLVCLPHYLH